jgi:hypothetical protein
VISPTTPTHANLPYPHGTFVEDTHTGLQGHLTAVVTERLKKTDKVVSETAFVRPAGGGTEWSAPLEQIKPVLDSAPLSSTANTSGVMDPANCVHLGVGAGQLCPRCKTLVGQPVPAPAPQR